MLEEAVTAPDAVNVALDTTWVLFCAFLVFFMNTGFGCVEAGFCRAKNAVNILAKNFVVFGLSSIAFWAIGFGIMFSDGNSILGLSGWLLQGVDTSPLTGNSYTGVFSSLNWAGIPLLAKFFFQLAFAATAATIVSGCVAERVHYLSFLIFATLLVAVLYPITGHWIWGGGWLAQLGFWDFAGSTVVHSVGGWAGLTGIILLGPRIGKFHKDGGVRPLPGHSMPLAFIGGMILWLGWFGFNPGSTMAITGDNAKTVAHIVITTNLACAAGIIAATIASWIITDKPDFSMTINGALAGLVSITAPCAFVTPAAAVLIGAIGGALVVPGVRAFDRIKIDDPVGALSVHLLGGIWGTLAVGLFATQAAPGGIDQNGLFYGGGTSLLGIQTLGVVAVGAFTLTTSLALWYLLKQTLSIRVSAETEAEGLDVHEMGSEAYPHEPAVDVAYLLYQSHMGKHKPDITVVRPDPEEIPAHVMEQNQPYIIKLHNIEPKQFLEAWKALCGKEGLRSEDFRSIYRYFTTFEGARLRFRGGDPRRVLSKLQSFAGSIKSDAFAELECDLKKIYEIKAVS